MAVLHADRMIPRYKNLALETYGIEGIHVPISSFLHEPDPAVSKSVNKRQLSLLPWGLTIGLQAMTLQSMWQKYLYDQDAEYMEEKIYPYLRETARFYVNFMKLCETDADGKVRLGPSYSPEHLQPGIFNCPFDIAYVHYTFEAMIEVATLLGRDSELLTDCIKLKSLLPEYPTAPTENGEHIVVDWIECKVGQIKQHNITVPASPVFPADQITWFDDEATKELYRRTIDALNFRDANAHVMLNIARARLSMLEASDKLKAWFETRERPNGLFEWTGHGHAVYMPEMIGIAGFINELLLQSIDNKIRLFPCWPQELDAEFTRLRAQGGFIVSAKFKDGRIDSARIESVANKKLHLLSPWNSIYVNGKRTEIDDRGLVSLDTKPGQVFEITETNER
jgi:alpha-L-fucosidase 2